MSTSHNSANQTPGGDGLPVRVSARAAAKILEVGAQSDCHARLCPEPEGGFSIHCLNLPGVLSEGETEAEALANIADAYRETIAYYREANIPIPWGEVEVESTAGSFDRSVVVTL